MVPVRLRLQEADPGVELGGDVEVLVVRGHDAHEGGFVCADLSDVAVAAVTKLRMAIAAILGLLWRAVEGLVDLCGDVDDGTCQKE